MSGFPGPCAGGISSIPPEPKQMSRIRLALLFPILLAACSTEPTGPVAVATVAVTPGDQTLHSLGETVQLTATVKDAAGNPIEGRDVTWTTDNGAVATVTSG